MIVIIRSLEATMNICVMTDIDGITYEITGDGVDFTFLGGNY